MRIGLVALSLILASFTHSCSAQSLVWPKVESVDAGFEALFRCTPEVSKKLFQKVPQKRLMYTLMSVISAGINFSVSLPERFHKSDPVKANEELEGVEQSLKSMIGSMRI